MRRESGSDELNTGEVLDLAQLNGLNEEQTEQLVEQVSFLEGPPTRYDVDMLINAIVGSRRRTKTKKSKKASKKSGKTAVREEWGVPEITEYLLTRGFNEEDVTTVVNGIEAETVLPIPREDAITLADLDIEGLRGRKGSKSNNRSKGEDEWDEEDVIRYALAEDLPENQVDDLLDEIQKEFNYPVEITDIMPFIHNYIANLRGRAKSTKSGKKSRKATKSGKRSKKASKGSKRVEMIPLSIASVEAEALRYDLTTRQALELDRLLNERGRHEISRPDLEELIEQANNNVAEATVSVTGSVQARDEYIEQYAAERITDTEIKELLNLIREQHGVNDVTTTQIEEYITVIQAQEPKRRSKSGKKAPKRSLKANEDIPLDDESLHDIGLQYNLTTAQLYVLTRLMESASTATRAIIEETIERARNIGGSNAEEAQYDYITRFTRARGISDDQRRQILSFVRDEYVGKILNIAQLDDIIALVTHEPTGEVIKTPIVSEEEEEEERPLGTPTPPRRPTIQRRTGTQSPPGTPSIPRRAGGITRETGTPESPPSTPRKSVKGLKSTRKLSPSSSSSSSSSESESEEVRSVSQLLASPGSPRGKVGSKRLTGRTKAPSERNAILRNIREISPDAADIIENEALTYEELQQLRNRLQAMEEEITEEDVRDLLANVLAERRIVSPPRVKSAKKAGRKETTPPRRTKLSIKTVGANLLKEIRELSPAAAELAHNKRLTTGERRQLKLGLEELAEEDNLTEETALAVVETILQLKREEAEEARRQEEIRLAKEAEKARIAAEASALEDKIEAYGDKHKPSLHNVRFSIFKTLLLQFFPNEWQTQLQAFVAQAAEEEETTFRILVYVTLDRSDNLVFKGFNLANIGGEPTFGENLTVGTTTVRFSVANDDIEGVISATPYVLPKFAQFFASSSPVVNAFKDRFYLQTIHKGIIDVFDLPADPAFKELLEKWVELHSVNQLVRTYNFPRKIDDRYPKILVNEQQLIAENSKPSVTVYRVPLTEEEISKLGGTDTEAKELRYEADSEYVLGNKEYIRSKQPGAPRIAIIADSADLHRKRDAYQTTLDLQDTLRRMLIKPPGEFITTPAYAASIARTQSNLYAQPPTSLYTKLEAEKTWRSICGKKTALTAQDIKQLILVAEAIEVPVPEDIPRTALAPFLCRAISKQFDIEYKERGYLTQQGAAPVYPTMTKNKTPTQQEINQILANVEAELPTPRIRTKATKK